MVARLPDRRTQRFADAEANTDCCSNNEQTDEDLNNHPVPAAEVRQAVAVPVLALGRLVLPLPVSLTRPHLAVIVGAGGVALTTCQIRRRAPEKVSRLLSCVGGVHLGLRLNIRVEWVQSCPRHAGRR